MPTIKDRINLSVSKTLSRTLGRLAARDDRSVSSKALELIERALEIEEDIILEDIVAKRDSKGTKYISHDQAWR